MSGPKVTIGIPTVNRLGFLREAVLSARTQGHGDIEVLVSRDGTADPAGPEIAEFVGKVAAEDGRVVYVQQPSRLGLAGNWNAIARRATGEYTMIMGDDDRLLPSCVETLVATAAALDADVVFSDHWVIDSEGGRLLSETDRCSDRYGRTRLQEGLLAAAHSVVWRNSIPMSASLVRTEWLRKLGFRPDLNCPELEFFARAANAGARFAFVKQRLVEYRSHAMSETSAGLTLESLFTHLAPIPVPDPVAAQKASLLKALLPAALAREWRRGNWAGIRALARSGYIDGPLLARNPKVVGLLLLSWLRGKGGEVDARPAGAFDERDGEP